MDDDMDDPMAKASPRPKNTYAVNGYQQRARGQGMQPGVMVNVSMNDDIIDPISVSMEMSDNRNEQRARASPGLPYQSDHNDQRHATMPQYRQQQPSYAAEPKPTEPARGWQTGKVRLERREGQGFGLAVFGGADKPLASGETSIVVSDILDRGPADGKLMKEDRLLIVDGISMTNVNHAVAVGALRNAGASVVIEYRRWGVAPPTITKSQTLPAASTSSNTLSSGYYGVGGAGSGQQSSSGLRGSQLSLTNTQGPPGTKETITLSKSRNEGFGLQLGWRLYVQGLSEYGVAASQGLNKGDTIVKINGYPVDTLSLTDARRLMQTAGNSINLEIVREPAPVSSTPDYNSRADRLSIGSGGGRDYPSPRLPHAGSYEQPQPQPPYQQPQQYQQQQQQWQQPPLEVRSPFPEAPEEQLTYEQDDPLSSSLPPRPPLPGVGQHRGNYTMPPPRPPSPGRQEFMGRSTAL